MLCNWFLPFTFPFQRIPLVRRAIVRLTIFTFNKFRLLLKVFLSILQNKCNESDHGDGQKFSTSACVLSWISFNRGFINDLFTICRYVPPTSTSPNLPETPDEISMELSKQESFLSQIHSEMNAGFVTKKREEELWETQRIITQLKVSLSGRTAQLVLLCTQIFMELSSNLDSCSQNCATKENNNF